MSNRKLYAVGLGPGGADLITVKGKKILEELKCIFYPVRSVSETGVALSILSSMIKLNDKVCKPLVFPMVNDKKVLSHAWLEAGRIINEQLEADSDAAFITEGDPLFFSTFCYLLDILSSHYPDIDVEIVPGITSFCASSATGRVVMGKSMGSVMIVPASSNMDMITKLVESERKFDTLVLMKIKSVFEKIVDLIEKNNLPFLFAERCSMPGEIIIDDIIQLKKHNPDYFSLLITGAKLH